MSKTIPPNPLDANPDQLGEVAHQIGQFFASVAYVHVMNTINEDIPPEARVDDMLTRMKNPREHGLALKAGLVKGIQIAGVDVGQFCAKQGLALIGFTAKDPEFSAMIPPYTYVAAPAQVWQDFAKAVLTSYKHVIGQMAELMETAQNQAVEVLGEDYHERLELDPVTEITLEDLDDDPEETDPDRDDAQAGEE